MTNALKLEDLVGCEPMVSGYVRLRSGKVAHQREYLPLLLPLIEERELPVVELPLACLTAEQRLDVFSQYCRGCGTDDLPCHCENDE